MFSVISATNRYDFENVGSLEGFEYPESIVAIDYIAGDQSAYLASSKSGKRNLSFQAVIPYEDRQSVLNVVKVGGLKTLLFEYCGQKYQTEVEFTKVLSPFKFGNSVWLFEAVAPDWRIYGQTLNKITAGETILLGGTQIPATIPMSFVIAPNSNSFINVVNNGNEVTLPIFKIYGEGTQFEVHNTTINENFIIDYTLTNGEYITVDVLNRTVIEGNNNLYDDFTGEFFKLVSGLNRLQFFVVGSGDNTKIEIEYRDAFIGI